MTYGLMPSQAASASNVKQMYINGHFCYSDKFAIITNGLGIVRHIVFLDDDFNKHHPNIEINKKSDSHDEDKSIDDSSVLKPILQNFLNPILTSTIQLFLGIVLLTLLRLIREKGRADRIKWICPKIHIEKGKYVCHCDNPCSTAKKGRTTYTYENMSFRMFPGIQRDSEEWNTLYKVCTVVEWAINHFKMSMCIASRKSRDHLTTKADVLLAGIASQFTTIIAHRLSYPQYIRSLKPLIA